METKIKKYQEVIISILERFAKNKYANMPNLENQILIDEKRHHYQLVSIGWHKKEFVYHTVFHFDIKPDGQVWLQANWTDIDIGEEMIEKGIDENDIVVGFIPERFRSALKKTA